MKSFDISEKHIGRSIIRVKMKRMFNRKNVFFIKE